MIKNGLPMEDASFLPGAKFSFSIKGEESESCVAAVQMRHTVQGEPLGVDPQVGKRTS